MRRTRSKEYDAHDCDYDDDVDDAHHNDDDVEDEQEEDHVTHNDAQARDPELHRMRSMSLLSRVRSGSWLHRVRSGHG